MHPYSAASNDRADTLERAKSELLKDLPLSNAFIPAGLIGSWQRSYLHGLRPGDRKLVDPDASLQIIGDKDRYLSGIVGEEIDAIWDSFGGENWVVYCVNAQGLIIRARHGSNPASRSFALHVGRRIQERDIGTTAPACAFHEKKPITLVGAEHYLEEFVHLFCCAVPLWGPWGNIVGVLCITGSEQFKSRLLERKLANAAARVENRLFRDAHQTNTVFRIHYDEDFIDTHLAGLIAVNEFGDILSASRQALDMLDQIDPFARRYNLDDLFTEDFSAAGVSFAKTHLKNGIVFYARSCASAVLEKPEQVADELGERSLKTMSSRHILETLQRTGGNVSKTARLLGISRTTVYRANKMHQEGLPSTDQHLL